MRQRRKALLGTNPFLALDLDGRAPGHYRPVMTTMTRGEARARGLKQYVTGRPCVAGHIVERYVSTGQCEECLKAHHRCWRQSNAERERKLAREQYKANPDKFRKKAAAWATAHPDIRRHLLTTWKAANVDRVRLKDVAWRRANKKHLSERFRQWRKANVGKANAHVARRRAARIQRTPSWADLPAINRFYDIASHLTRTSREPWEVDHEIPLRGRIVSGLHVETNLRIVRKSDNASKGNKFYGLD